MRLIDADELIATIALEIETKSLIDRRNLFDIIDSAPTIDAEPVRWGRWESIDWANEYFKCSGCGRIERWSPNYCPNCGLKMANRTRYVGTSNIIEEPNCGARMEEQE